MRQPKVMTMPKRKTRLDFAVELANLHRDQLSLVAWVLEAFRHRHRVWIVDVAYAGVRIVGA